MDYELPTLPDGSKGLFIRAYRLTRNKREKDNTITMIKYHIQMKLACSKWIRTNIINPQKIVYIYIYLQMNRESFQCLECCLYSCQWPWCRCFSHNANTMFLCVSRYVVMNHHFALLHFRSQYSCHQMPMDRYE